MSVQTSNFQALVQISKIGVLIIAIIFSNPPVKTYNLGAQKYCLNETLCLSTHNMHVRFG